nr:hypothetical protein [Alistipes sp.]
MKKLIMTVVALMGVTTLFAQTDVVATFQQGLANAKAANYTEAIAQFQEVVDASWDIEEKCWDHCEDCRAMMKKEKLKNTQELMAFFFQRNFDALSKA